MNLIRDGGPTVLRAEGGALCLLNKISSMRGQQMETQWRTYGCQETKAYVSACQTNTTVNREKRKPDLTSNTRTCKRSKALVPVCPDYCTLEVIYVFCDTCYVYQVYPISGTMCHQFEQVSAQENKQQPIFRCFIDHVGILFHRYWLSSVRSPNLSGRPSSFLR